MEFALTILIILTVGALNQITLGELGRLEDKIDQLLNENNHSRRPACPAEEPQGSGPAAADGQDV